MQKKFLLKIITVVGKLIYFLFIVNYIKIHPLHFILYVFFNYDSLRPFVNLNFGTFKNNIKHLFKNRRSIENLQTLGSSMTVIMHDRFCGTIRFKILKVQLEIGMFCPLPSDKSRGTI